MQRAKVACASVKTRVQSVTSGRREAQPEISRSQADCQGSPPSFDQSASRWRLDSCSKTNSHALFATCATIGSSSRENEDVVLKSLPSL